MLRVTIAFLMILFAAGQVCAGCESTSDPVTGNKEATLYLNAHMVSHSQYGDMKANNHLRIWNGDEKEMCFSLMTIANEYHECLLEGKAIQIVPGEYEFRQNKCRLLFKFNRDEVAVHATGAKGKYCKTDDFGIGHGCGFNTTIDSATYKKAKPAARSDSR